MAAAHALASDGLRIVVADLHREAAEAAARSLPGEGHAGLAVDVRSAASVGALFDDAEERLGPVAALATFAGILISDGKRRVGIADSTLDD